MERASFSFLPRCSWNFTNYRKFFLDFSFLDSRSSLDGVLISSPPPPVFRNIFQKEIIFTFYRTKRNVTYYAPCAIYIACFELYTTEERVYNRYKIECT